MREIAEYLEATQVLVLREVLDLRRRRHWRALRKDWMTPADPSMRRDLGVAGLH